MGQPTDAPLELFHLDEQRDFANGAPRPATIPHYFALEDIRQLGAVLERDGRYFIEVGSQRRPGGEMGVLQKEKPDFGLCLTTLHTYNPHVAGIVTAALNNRFGLSRQKKMHIVTCLQEALSNAVIHGNLRIRCPRDSLEGFQRYFTLTAEAARSVEYRDMRVYVRAWDYGNRLRLCVTHEGAGRLSPAMIRESGLRLEQKCGRGLFIIQSLAEQVSTDAECTSIHIVFAY